MNFLFTTWEGGGTVTPFFEAARKVVAKGHHVRVMSEECNRPEAASTGATFIAWKRALSRKERTPESQTYRDWEGATAKEGIISIVRNIWCGPALKYAHDVIEELEREPADLVVTIETLFGVQAACESLKQNYATLSPYLCLTPIPGIPPLGSGAPPARNDAERALHSEIASIHTQMFDAGLPALNAARASLGLQPLEHVLDQIGRAEAELIAMPQSFDFPAQPLPSRVKYVGPQLADPKWTRPWTSPWPASDQRPLVVVGFSTTFQDHSRDLQNVIDALAPLPVRVLVTLGGSIKSNDLRPGDNCVLVESAPHSIVMREAIMTVNHGGPGTIMQGLLCHLPMLVIPHGRDQNDNAIRISEHGAGLVLMPGASVDSIRDACFRLLDDPSFRNAAKRLGELVANEIKNSTIVSELESIVLRR